MNSIADDFTYYYSKLYKFQNLSNCYDQVKGNTELILKAANRLNEFVAGNVSQSTFTDLCDDSACKEATMSLLKSLSNDTVSQDGYCNYLEMLYGGYIYGGYF